LGNFTRFPAYLVAAVAVVFGAAPAHAVTLDEMIADLVANHKQIKAAESDLEAAKQREKAAWGDWYPTFDFTGSWGKEKQNKTTGTLDTEEVPRELDFTVTQQLWDFGATDAGIQRASLQVERARLNLRATRQSLILQGIEAYLGVIRSKKVLGFAQGSVDNIRRQAELEDSRVQRGGGFTTDVLQAKTQLAGAEARRNNFAGAYRNAVSAFRRFFGKDPGEVKDMKEPTVPHGQLPQSFDDVIKSMHEENPGLLVAKIDADILRQTLEETRADELFPNLDAVAETKRKEDVGGTIGRSTEQLFKVELTYSFNLGLTQYNTIKAAKKDHLAAQDRYIDARSAFEQQARNQWSNLERDKNNAEFLKNQANIAGEFLELARRERQLGKRSLIDVLAGETALINANSDAAAAETDVKLDVYRLLNVMGRLTPDAIKSN